MQERELKMCSDNNPQPVVVDEKVKKDLLKIAKDFYFAVGTLHDSIKSNSLQEGFKNTLCSLLESYTVELHEKLNFASHLQKEHEQRFIEIRSLNNENHVLRKQLGEKVSNDDVREKLKILNEKIREWWNEWGFGYIREVEFHPYCCKVVLSCTMSISIPEGQPEKLQSIGYSITKIEGYDYSLDSSDKNIELLAAQIKSRFPSAKLCGAHTDFHRPNYSYIRECEFNIGDYNDI